MVLGVLCDVTTACARAPRHAPDAYYDASSLTRPPAARTLVAFESVMSTPEKIALLTQARERGYQVARVVVTTDDRNVSMTLRHPVTLI